jgi:hypothetical protein
MHTLDNFRHFLACVEIAHHIPGRIRLRLALDALSGTFAAPDKALLAHARNFQDALGRTPGVRAIRVNLVARSCTVEYDHRVIPVKAWSDLIQGEASHEAGVLTRIIEDKFNEVACA